MAARKPGSCIRNKRSDKTLIDMCVKKPTDRASMLEVSGVGEAEYEKYGERFLEELERV